MSKDFCLECEHHSKSRCRQCWGLAWYFDSRKAQDGKAKAIRQIPIVNEAFTKWNGELPSETALPAKLTDFKDISWQEAQKHAETLKKLFNEVFPYLKTTPQIPLPPFPKKGEGVRGDQELMDGQQEIGDMTISARGKDFGFTKTLPFTHAGIEEMRKLVGFLEGQVLEGVTEEPKKPKKPQE